MWKISWKIVVAVVGFLATTFQPIWGLFCAKPFVPWLFEKCKMSAPKRFVNWIMPLVGASLLVAVIVQSYTESNGSKVASSSPPASDKSPIKSTPDASVVPSTVVPAPATNSGNPSINISGNNNGNNAILQNSPNSTLNQSIVQKDPPFIMEVRLQSINELTSVEGFPTAYKTVFLIEVGNPSQRLGFSTSERPASQIGSLKAEATLHSGIGFGPGPVVSFVGVRITALTSEKVQESDFGTFSVQADP